VLNDAVPGKCETRWCWLYFGIEKILKMNEGPPASDALTKRYVVL
jgi:hypothetical protein